MASPAGLVNGTKIVLGIEDSGTPNTFNVLEGEATHSAAFSRALIEVTNKSSEQFREYLAGNEGTKALDVSVEALLSTDNSYADLRAAYWSGNKIKVRRTIGSLVLNADMLVESMSDSANLNEAVKSSFSLKSTGAFTEA